MKDFILLFFSYRQVENLRSFLYSVIYYSGLARLISLFKKPGAAILCYHSVRQGGVFSDNILSEATFAGHVRYLLAHCEVVSMARLVAQLKSGNPVPGNWVVMTFDDGYGDNARTVLPALLKEGLPGVFFPATDVILRRFVFFYDKIQNMLEQFSGSPLEIEVSGQKERLALGSREAVNDAALRLVLSVRNESQEERDTLVQKLADKMGVQPGVDENIYMSETEVRALSRAGMEIGSHTKTHTNLKILPDGKLREELRESKAILEKITESPVLGFSYPFGKKIHFNERIQAEVEKAGYEYALTTVFGRVQQGADFYALPRMGVGDLIRLKVNLMGIQI